MWLYGRLYYTNKELTHHKHTHTHSYGFTRFSDGQRELCPQLCLQVLVVVRIGGWIKQTFVFAPEIDQHVVHCGAPVWPPDLTPKVCHVVRSKLCIIYNVINRNIFIRRLVLSRIMSHFFFSFASTRMGLTLTDVYTATNWRGGPAVLQFFS